MGIDVLIVDDLTFIKMVLKDLVEKAGFRVVGEASNGEEAVQLFEEQGIQVQVGVSGPVDMVICDFIENRIVPGESTCHHSGCGD